MGLGSTGGSDDALVTVVGGQTNDAPSKAEGKLVGERLGRYHVLELVGAGGMGEVYRAYDSKLKREVALKLLRNAAATTAALGDASTRLMREAQAMARLSHPNVLPVFDTGDHGGLPFLAMEFVEGKTLSDWAKEGTRSEGEVLEIYRSAGAGLAAAHDTGFVHRDFKPSNVMIGVDGRVRVMDFGLVRLEDETGGAAGSPPEIPDDALSTSLTLHGSVVGTPVYMSPEQHHGDASGPKSDQYAFCVSLFKTLYGQFPFDKGSLRDLVRTKESQPPKIPKTPQTAVRESVREAIFRGLSADPDERWPDMRSLLGALEPARTPNKRWWAMAIAVTTLGAAGLASGSTPPDDPCANTRSRLDGTWTESRATQLRAADVAATSPQLVKTSIALMDMWADAWTREAVDACRLQQAQATLAASRLRCLERQRVQARAVGDRLSGGLDATSIATAHAAAESLEKPSACLGVLEETLDPELEAAIAAHEAELATFKTDAFFLTTEELDARLEAIDQAAAELDHGPTSMRTSSAKAHALLINHRARPAAEAYRDAFFRAVRGRSEQEAGRLAVRLTGVVGDNLDKPQEGLAWSLHAEAWIDLDDGATLGDLRLQRGRIRYRQDDFEGALSDAVEAQALLDAAHGRAHTLVESAINNQANALLRLKRFDEAEAKHREALELQQELYGIGHPKTAIVWLNLGSGQAEAGKYKAAVESFHRAERIYQDVDPNHPRLSAVYSNLGAAMALSGDVESALTSFSAAVKSLEATGADASERISPLGNLAMAQVSLERHEDAIATLEATIEAQREVDPRSDQLTKLYVFTATSHGALDRHAEAISMWLQALRAAEDAGEPVARMTYLRTELGKAQVELGDDRGARRNLELALKLGQGDDNAMPEERHKEIETILKKLANQRR